MNLIKKYLYLSSCTINLILCSDYSVLEVKIDDNLDEIVNVINSAYKKVPYLKETTTRITRPELENIIQDPTKKLYICKDTATICGTALLDLSYENPEMSLFAVHPHYNGKNIGKLLLDYVEKQVLLMNKKHLTIKVILLDQDTLIRYYQKNGFIFTDTTQEIDQTILERYMKEEHWGTLRFEIMSKQIN